MKKIEVFLPFSKRINLQSYISQVYHNKQISKSYSNQLDVIKRIK